LTLLPCCATLAIELIVLLPVAFPAPLAAFLFSIVIMYSPIFFASFASSVILNTRIMLYRASFATKFLRFYSNKFLATFFTYPVK
jgi:hypothetical protein